jgi:hypothetical protein
MHLQLTGASGYAWVALLGGFVGAIELAGRYRDDPMLSVRTPAGLIYLVVNMAASAAALGIVRTMGWNFGQDDLVPKNLVQISVAGLGAITLFRARLFNAAQPTDGGYGGGDGSTFRWSPGGLLGRLLRVVDAQVDRAQAKKRVRVAH